MPFPEQEPPSPEFVGLLTSHQADLWAYLLSLMPGSPDVADVLQKTNVVLWAKREQFEIGTNFRAWGFAVARFEVMNHRKRQRDEKRFVFDDDLLEKLADEAPEVLPPAQAKLDALEHCLALLRPKDRDLLDHRYRNGAGLDAYAKRSGRSISALSVTLFRLRVSLRRCISQHLAGKGIL